jgi:EAL domain-containing protein (putative c-di-GMP-specific phosphodiesterase class I)
MFEMHIPSYIAKSESIKSILTTSGSVLAIKIQNYFLIETIVGPDKMSSIISKVSDKINEFGTNNAFGQINIVSVYNYMFVIGSGMDSVRSLLITLERYMNTNVYDSLEMHLQFHLAYAHGVNIADNLSSAIQHIESTTFSSNVMIDNYNNAVQVTLDEYNMLSLLKTAVKEKTAGFAYQPIINSSSGKTEYNECLLRIQDKNGNWISAGDAIEVAEKYGIINIIDDAVLDMAVEELIVSKDVSISVNISNLGILNDDLLKKIQYVVQKHDIASRLIIEITETSINENFDKISCFVNTVQDLGCRVAVDDFGVGVTSFKQLREIKFDIIKIDGSFIKDIATSIYNKLVVDLIVKLSKEIGAKTVAECVENGAEAKLLLDMGIDCMQGHFFSPAQNFRSWSR